MGAAHGAALSRREWLALVAVFAAIQVAWIVAPAAASGPAGSTPGALIARSDAGRSFIWRDALGIAAAHPLLGVGHGNFAAARLHEMTGPMAAPNVNHAHNLFLQVASEWGLVGLVVVLAALAWWARAGLRILRDPQPEPMRLFALGVMLALFVHSLAEHPLWFTYFLLPFALCAGLLTGPRAAPEAAPRSRLAIGLGLVVAAAVGAVAAFDYQRLHHIAAGLRADAFREPGTPPAVQLADVVAAERLTLFPRPATLLLSAVLPINPTAAEAKLVVTRRAMDMIPAGQTMARWAAFAVLTGRQDDARRLLLAVRERHPPSYAEARELLQRSTFGQQALVDFADALPPP